MLVVTVERHRSEKQLCQPVLRERQRALLSKIIIFSTNTEEKQ